MPSAATEAALADAAPSGTPPPTSVAATATASTSPAPTAIRASPKNALFARFPGLAARVPFVKLGLTPTPVHEAAQLARALGVDHVYVKRDDLSSPVYGGSKVRKLEFLLADALARGHRRVITIGAVGSNQAAATAVFGRALGLEVRLLLLPQPPSDITRHNLLVAARAGASFSLVPSQELAEAQAARESHDEQGAATAALVPAGGSTPLGNLGFVDAALELDEQIRAGLLPEPERIYIAMGTMGSAVGLALGLALAERKCEVVAVRASSPTTSSDDRMRALVAATLAYLREREPTLALPEASALRLRIEGRQLGPGHGRETPGGARMLELARSTESLELEPTYTAKALAALAADRTELAGRVTLFWHTAGELPDVSDVDATLLPAELRAFANP